HDTHHIDLMRDKHLETLKSLSGSIYHGLTHDNVKSVQEALLYFGYYKGKLDGIYGPLTKEALVLAEHEFNMTFINDSSIHTNEEMVMKHTSEYKDDQTGYNEERLIETAKS